MAEQRKLTKEEAKALSMQTLDQFGGMLGGGGMVGAVKKVGQKAAPALGKAAKGVGAKLKSADWRDVKNVPADVFEAFMRYADNAQPTVPFNTGGALDPIDSLWKLFQKTLK